MASSHPLRWIIVPLCAALAALGCSGADTPPGETGSLSLNLVLAGGIEIDVVDWVITGGEMPPMGGTIDTSAPDATASIEVFGLPATIGQDYRITMEAIATDGETTCKGSEDFGIDVGEVTEIMVMLNCKRPERLGSVRVNGKFNVCAELTKVVVSPLQTSLGNDIDLFSAAEDLEDDDIHYLWIGTGGSIDNAQAASTTYTCTDLGDHFVKITVTDEPDSEYCDSSWTVQVRCVPEVEYEQNFESLDQTDPDALANDGWVIFGNVFQPDGTYLFGYGLFPAPNGGPGFSGIDVGQGGPEQGDQQLVIYSDYNNTEDQEAGNRVQANTFRERTITADDVGKTIMFSFGAKRGNINDPADAACTDTLNPCNSTANAFIRTVDPNAAFALTNDIPVDTTALPDTWGRYSISLMIDAGLVGQLLQVGFSATASNFEPSGVFYDNVLVTTSTSGGGAP